MRGSDLWFVRHQGLEPRTRWNWSRYSPRLRLLNLSSTEAEEENGTFREFGCAHCGPVGFSGSYRAVRTTNGPRLSEQTGAVT